MAEYIKRDDAIQIIMSVIASEEGFCLDWIDDDRRNSFMRSARMSCQNVPSIDIDDGAMAKGSKLYIPLNQHTVKRINQLHKDDCGDYFDEEWLYNELEQIAEVFSLSPETPINKVDTPTNTPTDLISRQAAIEALQKEIDRGIPPYTDTVGTVRSGVMLARDIIEDLPPVEPKRPKGEWIINPRVDAGRFEIKCSECGNTFIRCIGQMPNFCDYCGADMRGDKE